MATNQDDIIAINSRFYALWPEGVPVVMDNDANSFEPTQTWARLSIQPGFSVRASIAARTYRQLGRVYLQIFVPAQHGTSPGWDLAETFSTIFRDWRSSDQRILFNTPEFRISNAEPEYFTVICSIPYEATH